jgi:hypothetical protein
MEYPFLTGLGLEVLLPLPRGVAALPSPWESFKSAMLLVAGLGQSLKEEDPNNPAMPLQNLDFNTPHYAE